MLRELKMQPLDLINILKEYVNKVGLGLNIYRRSIVIEKARKFSEVKQLVNAFPEIAEKLYDKAGKSKSFVSNFLAYEVKIVTVVFGINNYTNCCLDSITFDNIKNYTPIIPSTTIVESLKYNPEKLFNAFFVSGKKKKSCESEHCMIVYRHRDLIKEVNLEQMGYTLSHVNKITFFAIPHIMRLIDGKRSCSEIVNEFGNILGMRRMPIFFERKILKIMCSFIDKGILLLRDEVY